LETSGFSPVTSEELEKVNGGSVVAVGAAMAITAVWLATAMYTVAKNSKSK
jgi:hypothetical protein